MNWLFGAACFLHLLTTYDSSFGHMCLLLSWRNAKEDVHCYWC